MPPEDATEQQQSLRARIQLVYKAASLRKKGLRHLKLCSHWEAAYDQLLEDLSIELDNTPKGPPPPAVDGIAIEPQGQRSALRTITTETAEYYGTPLSVLMGPWRDKQASEARHVAMYFARRYCPFLTLHQLGDYFDRDHSTILSGITKVEVKCREDSAFAARVDAVRGKLATALGCELATVS